MEQVGGVDDSVTRLQLEKAFVDGTAACGHEEAALKINAGGIETDDDRGQRLDVKMRIVAPSFSIQIPPHK